MSTRINPFRPNSPIGPGMFVGRFDEIVALEQSLVQTRAGQPQHFMVTGERGIGKTSLLSYLKFVAKGEIQVGTEKHNFLVVDVDIEKGTSAASFARRLERALRHELGKDEKVRDFFKKSWDFVKRFEAGSVRYNGKESITETEDLVDELTYSLVDTANRVCSGCLEGSDFSANFDGIIILIDEADSASEDLEFGALLKMLTERIQKRGCEKIMFGLAGLENLREILRESHPSVLRVFDEIKLKRLRDADVERVIDRCIEDANDNNEFKTKVEDDAKAYLVRLSEGYPHFIQQFGFSAFAVDNDGEIDIADVKEGAFGRRGALEIIGDKYYRDSFYGKIQKESYRQVLRIMAEKWDSWVEKCEIKAKFKGKDSTLNNAIRALRDRKIILSQEGSRGVYRLQHKGFALWIKYYANVEK